MKTGLVKFSLLLAVTVFLGAQGVVEVPNEDQAMKAAIEKARGSVGEFWSRLAAPAADEEDFSVKLRFESNGQVEHIWCNKIQLVNQVRDCEINNEPQAVNTVKMGERVAITEDRLSDWMYLKDGRIVGGETIRAILPYLAEGERAALEARFAPQ